MVMYLTMLMYLVLAEYIFYAAAIAAVAEQVQRLATDNASTSCRCEHVGNTAVAHITHMNNPHIVFMNHLLADLVELGKVEGF